MFGSSKFGQTQFAGSISGSVVISIADSGVRVDSVFANIILSDLGLGADVIATVKQMVYDFIVDFNKNEFNSKIDMAKKYADLGNTMIPAIKKIR